MRADYVLSELGRNTITNYLMELEMDENSSEHEGGAIQERWAKRLREVGLTIINVRGRLVVEVTADDAEKTTIPVLEAARAVIEIALKNIKDSEKES